MHSRRQLEVFRRTNSASTICLAMSTIGLKIAGTPTIAARLLMARRGSLETVVGAFGTSTDGSAVVIALLERACANHRARASPKVFSRRITESCSNGTIIVIIMNLCNCRLSAKLQRVYAFVERRMTWLLIRFRI